MLPLRRSPKVLAVGAVAALLGSGTFFHVQTRHAWADLRAEAGGARTRLAAAPASSVLLAGADASIEGSAFDAYGAAAEVLLGSGMGPHGPRVQEITRLTAWTEDEGSFEQLRSFVGEPAIQEALRHLRRGARSADKDLGIDWTSVEDLPLLMQTNALRTAAVAQATVLAAAGEDEAAASWHLDAAQLGVDILGGHTLVTSAIGFSTIVWAFYDDRGPAGDYETHGRVARAQLMEAARRLDGCFAFDPLVFDGEIAMAVGSLERLEDQGELGLLGWRSALQLRPFLAMMKGQEAQKLSIAEAYAMGDAAGFTAFESLVRDLPEPSHASARMLIPMYGSELSRMYARSKLRAVRLGLALSLGEDLGPGASLDALGVPFETEETENAFVVRSQGDSYTELSVRIAKLR